MKQYPEMYLKAIDDLFTPFVEWQVRELSLEKEKSVLQIGCEENALSRIVKKQHQEYFTFQKWEAIFEQKEFKTHDVVISDGIHDFRDIQMLCKRASGRIILSASVNKSLQDTIYDELYDGLAGDLEDITHCITYRKDYSSFFVMLYQYGIDPEIRIIENAIRKEGESLEELITFFYQLLPMKKGSRESFRKRMKNYIADNGQKVVFEMKHKEALLSWNVEN